MWIDMYMFETNLLCWLIVKDLLGKFSVLVYRISLVKDIQIRKPKKLRSNQFTFVKMTFDKPQIRAR